MSGKILITPKCKPPIMIHLSAFASPQRFFMSLEVIPNTTVLMLEFSWRYELGSRWGYIVGKY
jgi:hypothetical protein